MYAALTHTHIETTYDAKVKSDVPLMTTAAMPTKETKVAITVRMKKSLSMTEFLFFAKLLPNMTKPKAAIIIFVFAPGRKTNSNGKKKKLVRTIVMQILKNFNIAGLSIKHRINQFNDHLIVQPDKPPLTFPSEPLNRTASQGNVFVGHYIFISFRVPRFPQLVFPITAVAYQEREFGFEFEKR